MRIISAGPIKIRVWPHPDRKAVLIRYRIAGDVSVAGTIDSDAFALIRSITADVAAINQHRRINGQLSGLVVLAQLEAVLCCLAGSADRTQFEFRSNFNLLPLNVLKRNRAVIFESTNWRVDF